MGSSALAAAVPYPRKATRISRKGQRSTEKQKTENRRVSRGRFKPEWKPALSPKQNEVVTACVCSNPDGTFGMLFRTINICVR